MVVVIDFIILNWELQKQMKQPTKTPSSEEDKIRKMFLKKREPLTQEELNKLCCPNGSFTCGLRNALGYGYTCNLCKKSKEQLQQPNTEEICKCGHNKKEHGERGGDEILHPMECKYNDEKGDCYCMNFEPQPPHEMKGCGKVLGKYPRAPIGIPNVSICGKEGFIGVIDLCPKCKLTEDEYKPLTKKELTKLEKMGAIHRVKSLDSDSREMALCEPVRIEGEHPVSDASYVATNDTSSKEQKK